MPDGTPLPPSDSLDSRVALAAERTLLAWIRTGLAMMGFGFVVARFGLFLREMAAAESSGGAAAATAAAASGTGAGTGAGTAPPGSASLWIGVALVGLGVVVNLLATVEYIGMSRRFCRGVVQIVRVPSRLGIVVGIGLAGIGVFMALYLLAAFLR